MMALSRLFRLIYNYKRTRRSAQRLVWPLSSSEIGSETTASRAPSIEVSCLVGKVSSILILVNVHATVGVFFFLVNAVDLEVRVLLSKAFVDWETSLVHELLKATSQVFRVVLGTSVLDNFGSDQSPLAGVEVVLELLFGIEEAQVILIAHFDEGSLQSFVAVGDGAGAVKDTVEFGVAGSALSPSGTVLHKSQRECRLEKQQRLTSRMLIRVWSASSHSSNE
jgi:hypothetical protein